MRLPDPIANTTTEAYLAYKAGVLAEGDLKPKLYEPYTNLDAWLAYWTGLAADYPKKPTVNLFDKNKITVGVRVSTSNGGTYPQAGYAVSSYIPVSPLTTYVLVCGTADGGSFFSCYDSSKHYISGSAWQNKRTWKTPANARYIKFDFKESEKDIVQFEKAPLSPYSPYTNEPLILQDEEAYIAYLSGVTDTYPQEFRDPADIRVAAYLRYLISARFGRPEYPVTNEELYLSMLKTKYIPSGDPSSDIVIDGTAKAPFQDVKMYGDTFQRRYTGKNLWGGFLSDFSRTSQGISYTNKADGTILANGTSSGNALSLLSSDAISNGRIITLQAGDYVLSGGTSTVLLQVVSSSGEEIAETASDGVKAFTLSVATDIFVRARMARDTVADNVTIKPMLEAGSTATDYEPFVGGQPSPNPDYPQQIQTVTGEQTVEIQGKNLFRAKDGQYRDNSLTVDVENGVIHVYGHQHAAYDQNIWIPVEDIHADGTYTLTMNYRGSGGGAFRLTKDKSYQAANNFGGTYYAPNRGTPVTASATDITYNWVLIYLGHGSSLSEVDYYINPQFESGSLSTGFAPYSKQTLHLNLGTIELCKIGDYQDYIWKDGDDWKVHKATKTITASSNDFSSTSSSGGFRRATIALAGMANSGSASRRVGSAITNLFHSSTTDGASAQFQTLANMVIYASSTTQTYQELMDSIDESGMIVTYALATPTDTTITDQTLIAQLEALVAGGAEDGTTYIKVSATDPNLPGLLYVEAPKYE